MKKTPKNKKTSIKPKTVQVSKSQILLAIEKQDAIGLENSLLAWWNQQYPNIQVFNISQIKQWVNPEMQNLIAGIESHLYSSDSNENFNKQEWIKQVKGKGLVAIEQKINHKAAELPALY